MSSFLMLVGSIQYAFFAHLANAKTNVNVWCGGNVAMRDPSCLISDDGLLQQSRRDYSN